MKAIKIALIALLCTACNKEQLPAETAMQVLINGYNGSTGQLEVQIDTTRYKGNYLLKPGALVGFNAVYTYVPQPSQQLLTIKDPANGNVLLSKPLPVNGTKAIYNFIYIDGAQVEVVPPAADAATNKLGFYIAYADKETLLDIFLYRRDNNTGQEFRQYLAKNVKPGTWIYGDYLPTADFDSMDELANSFLCFTKTGTTAQWAFQDNENMSKLSAGGMVFPIAGEKGLVQPYFVIPGAWQLEMARLFFYPDRI